MILKEDFEKQLKTVIGQINDIGLWLVRWPNSETTRQLLDDTAKLETKLREVLHNNTDCPL